MQNLIHATVIEFCFFNQITKKNDEEEEEGHRHFSKITLDTNYIKSHQNFDQG